MLRRTKQKNPSYSYFAAGVTLEGSLRFQGVIRLDGNITGQIYAPGTLVALETSVIKGDIFVENLSLSGTVYGNIKASKLVHLEVTAKVYGDISYGELSIEVGALHEGSSHKLLPAELEELGHLLNPQVTANNEETSSLNNKVKNFEQTTETAEVLEA